jgi:enterochelin esterase-like enzyme
MRTRPFEAGEVEPLIIVGIYNTGDRRLAEYTHERDWQMGGGEANEYGLMLTRELLPWIAGQYRVRTDRESTGLGGSSLGGSSRSILDCATRRGLASWP